VEVVETHMALVFLTDRHAYKLKKPVILPFLDFGTLEARRHLCAEEVRLNRRLAPKTYLGTIALTLDNQGRLQLGGTGPAVDWLVRMVRLPADRVLDHVLALGQATEAAIIAVATVLAKFYAGQPPIRLDPAAHRRFFLDEIARTIEALVQLRGSTRRARAERIVAALRAFVAERSHLLEQRIVDGRIIEGHGDLRPEHVYLNGTPVIIDCLEFNRALRLIDPTDELTYLGVRAAECSMGGANPRRDLRKDMPGQSGTGPHRVLRMLSR
jgi:aminoglycoside phosphotransferase family enzyme